MTWVRIDDRFPTHRKAIAVGPLGRDLFVCGLCYCNAHLTDGFIPEDAITAIWPAPPDLKQTLSTLLGGAPSKWSDKRAQAAWTLLSACTLAAVVLHGLFHRVPGGYRVHDYEQWNRTREQVEGLKGLKRQAGRIGGARSGAARRAQAQSKQSASQDEADTKQSAALLPNPSPIETKSLSGSKQSASTNGHVYPWPDGVDHAQTNWRPNDTIPYEVLNHDCPDRAWRGAQCVSSAYVHAHPDAMATFHLPAALGPDHTPVPKQCPVHRAEVTPAW